MVALSGANVVSGARVAVVSVLVPVVVVVAAVDDKVDDTTAGAAVGGRVAAVVAAFVVVVVVVGGCVAVDGNLAAVVVTVAVVGASDAVVGDVNSVAFDGAADDWVTGSFVDATLGLSNSTVVYVRFSRGGPLGRYVVATTGEVAAVDGAAVGRDVPIVDTSTYVAFGFEIVVPYELFFISLNAANVVSSTSSSSSGR